MKPVGKPGVQAYKEGEWYLIKSKRKDEPEIGQPIQGLKTNFTLFQILFWFRWHKIASVFIRSKK